MSSMKRSASSRRRNVSTTSPNGEVEESESSTTG
jgi:hypothetical protein